MSVPEFLHESIVLCSMCRMSLENSSRSLSYLLMSFLFAFMTGLVDISHCFTCTTVCLALVCSGVACLECFAASQLSVLTKS